MVPRAYSPAQSPDLNTHPDDDAGGELLLSRDGFEWQRPRRLVSTCGPSISQSAFTGAGITVLIDGSGNTLDLVPRALPKAGIGILQCGECPE